MAKRKKSEPVAAGEPPIEERIEFEGIPVELWWSGVCILESEAGRIKIFIPSMGAQFDAIKERMFSGGEKTPMTVLGWV